MVVDNHKLSQLHLSEEYMHLLQVILLGNSEGSFNHVGSEVKLFLGVIFRDRLNLLEVPRVR